MYSKRNLNSASNAGCHKTYYKYKSILAKLVAEVSFETFFHMFLYNSEISYRSSHVRV